MHLDSFWKGFSTNVSRNAKKPVVLPIPAHIVVAPLPWIVDQVSGDFPSSSSSSRVEDVAKKPRVEHQASSSCQNGPIVDNGLRCPSCDVLCGYFEKKGLLLCSGYMVVDLFALSNTSLRKKRMMTIQ